MYQGSIDALDPTGEEWHFILYWSKTDGLLWPAKSGPASLLTECGNPVMFVERPEGIVFRGTRGQDAPLFKLRVVSGADRPYKNQIHDDIIYDFEN